jgi:hypothetical protein
MDDTPIPTRRRLPARLFSRRTIAGGMFLVACFATVIAVIYAVENWRGQRAWKEAKNRLQARGRVFDASIFVPAPVPDEQNFFKAPGMESFIKGRSNTFSSHLGAASSRAPLHYTRREPIVAAEVRVVSPATPIDQAETAAVLTFDDTGTGTRALQLLGQALGASMEGPTGNMVTARDLEQTRPAQIILRSATPLSAHDLERLFPTNASATLGPAANKLRLEPSGADSYRVLVAPSPGVIAAEYLAATDPFEADCEALRQALKRPYCRIEGDYEHLFAMPIPNFVLVRNLAQTLAQRAQCHLLLGQPEAAWRDVALVREMCRLLGPKPEDKPVTLVSAMIEVAVTGLYVQIVKDGLRLHAWREPQLTSIQAQLAQVQLLPRLSAAMDSEMVAVCAIFERSSPEEIANLFSFGEPKAGVIARLRNPTYVFHTLAPRGWVLQNMATIALRNQEALETLDLTNNRISAHSVDAFALREGTRTRRSTPYNWMAAASVPNFAKALQTLARNQTRANQALIACALERARLATGRYPGSLDELVPQYLEQPPRELFTGKPFIYRATPEGSYVLYSVGWNETDEGGVPGKGNLEDDWVWRPELTSL